MSRQHHRRKTGETRSGTHPWFIRWADRVVIGSVCIIPLFIVVGTKETFRLPKDVLFRAEAIVLLALFAASLFLGRSIPRIEWSSRFLLIPLLIVAWTVIGTLLSTNRWRSIDALTTVCASAVVYLASVATARRSPFTVIVAVIVPAVINALLGALQELHIWNPLPTAEDIEHHVRSTALIGNPNDAGGYLAVITLATLAAAIVSRSRRTMFVILTIVLIAGLLINQTLTAIIALAAGAIALLMLMSWKRAVAALLAVAIVFVAAVAILPPLHERYTNTVAWLRTGEYNALVTGRLTAFVAAFMMFRDHPLIGVGPGCFAWQYFPYKLRAELAYPPLRRAFHRGENYGEVHNDHLQLLAEGGLPAYALALAALVALASISFVRRGEKDSKRDFARLMALPLGVTIFVLAVAQFPLELTAVTSQFIFLAALCIGWSEK